MAGGTPSSLKKLSDDALEKRLRDLRESLAEISEQFTRETEAAYARINGSLDELEAVDLDARFVPIIEEATQDMNARMDEFVEAAKSDEREIDRMAKSDETEETAGAGEAA